VNAFLDAFERWCDRGGWVVVLVGMALLGWFRNDIGRAIAWFAFR